jgi:urease accessory protein
MNADLTLLRLLQLTSPALPVGAYSYSEGLETLVERGTVQDVSSLHNWLEQELTSGAIRVEAAVLLRAYAAAQKTDLEALKYWNDWISAFRETEEMRSQSWQMGRSLLRLLQDTHQVAGEFTVGLPETCNFAIAFALAAAHWQIDPHDTTLGYLQSWLVNLVSVGVRLIPLGQTAGQQLLLDLYPTVSQVTQAVLTLKDDDLLSCSWGLALASMAHETQYTRLFRS